MLNVSVKPGAAASVTNSAALSMDIPMLFSLQAIKVTAKRLTNAAWIAGGVTAAAMAIAPRIVPVATAQEAQNRQPITLLSDVQEANSQTGVVTARGNVQIFYPARDMQATSAQAQYYSREGRILLTGDVYVLQDGNSIQGERITYLVNEGRFVALPDAGEQVQSVYLLPTDDASSSTVSAPAADFNPKPEFKDPVAAP
ncbi:MAG: LptA/OstA family protein [Elainellaceae cyanobacterium]